MHARPSPDAAAPVQGYRASCGEGEAMKSLFSPPVPDATATTGCGEGWAEVPSSIHDDDEYYDEDFSKYVSTVLPLDTMPTKPPELPVSHCQRPCPPLRNPQESPDLHDHADDVLVTVPTIRPGPVISLMHNFEHETCPMPNEAILARAWRPTL